MLVFTKQKVVSIPLLIFYVIALTSARNPTKVLTKQGYVNGVREEVQTKEGVTKTIYKFLGVPYVEKPLGDLRFKPPQTLRNQRTGIYQAASHPHICYQDKYYFPSIKGAWPEFDPKRNMSEDCLYLNIYTPSTRGTRRYPVIVHIHGGSYIAGTPVRDISPGEYLPTRDVVLVTIQYRLGTFGFFSTGDSEAPGNLGLLDQVEALKWVQENIDGFCGDKNSVTLLGESAGGSSVSLHYLSPLSIGLFHRGIAVSGVDFSPFALKPKSTVLKASEKLVKDLNCQNKTSNETIQCLKSIQASTIFHKSTYWLMQPFVDRHFLMDELKKLRKEGKYQKLPLISGFVSQEGSFVLQHQKITKFNSSSFKSYLKMFFKQATGLTKVHEGRIAYKSLESKYTPDIKNSSEFRKKLVEMLSDYYMMAPTHAVLTFQSDERAPTYMFEFAHRSQHHPKPQWMGVVHEDTTVYKFGLPFLGSKSSLRFDNDDKVVSDMVVSMFTNFAKFGKPTPRPVNGVKWNPFNSSSKAYLKIKKNPLMTSKYHEDRMAFWNSKFPKLLSKSAISSSSEEPVSSDFVMKSSKPGGNLDQIFW